MSWSRNYSGTAQECQDQFGRDRDAIIASLPEFEKSDIGHVEKAAQYALNVVPDGAKVSLSVAGHGFRVSTGGGGGAVSVSVNYSLVAEKLGSPVSL